MSPVDGDHLESCSQALEHVVDVRQGDLGEGKERIHGDWLSILEEDAKGNGRFGRSLGLGVRGDLIEFVEELSPCVLVVLERLDTFSAGRRLSGAVLLGPSSRG